MALPRLDAGAGIGGVMTTKRSEVQSADLAASVQELAGALAIRIHPPGGRFGDPYIWSCVVIPDGSVAVIHLVARAPKPAERRALVKALCERGFASARWERRRNGSSRWTREFRR